jgi:hypothetical protein
MNWKTMHKNIGNLFVGQRVTIKFEATKELPEILKISSSCGCSKPEYDVNSKVLTVNYKAQSVPKHRKAKGWYNTTKKITVVYKDGSHDILSFTSVVRSRRL